MFVEGELKQDQCCFDVFALDFWSMQRKHCSSLIVGYSTFADLKSALYTDCTKYTRIFSSQPPLMYLFTKYSWLLLSLFSNSSQRHLWCIQCLVSWISSGLTSVLCVSFETSSMDISASSEWGCASYGLRLRSASSCCFGVALVWPELHRACSKLPVKFTRGGICVRFRLKDVSVTDYAPLRMFCALSLWT